VDIVVTMLPTGQDVRDVLLGARARTEAGPAIASSSASSSATASATEFGPAPASLAAALREGAVVVDMSSSDPIGTRELGRLLASRRIALIDAPVSGL